MFLGYLYTVVRRLFIVLLLPLYIATICRTALPFLDYSLNYDFIVSTLCENKDKPALKCNGRCHLKKSIKAQEENEQRDGSRERVQTVDWSCDVYEIDSTAPPVASPSTRMYSYRQTTLFRAATPPFPPPRA